MDFPDSVLLDYGSGGKASQRLISELFVRYFDNPVLNRLDDAALLQFSGPLAMSTDSFTVDPLFFPGGDIGSLAVHGTVNDVAMLGAKPVYLSSALILEEGLRFSILEAVVSSMSQAALKAGVQIVTGDTKVVPRGSVDKVFINTTGLGQVLTPRPPQGDRARPGDAILISGEIGEHGLTILSQRQGLKFETPVQSDSQALNHMLCDLVDNLEQVHVLRDPTRGGLATTLNEISGQSGTDFVIQEQALPISDAVRSGCAFLGLDPLFLANEGKAICIVAPEEADQALGLMHAHEEGQKACQIGWVQAKGPGRVVLETTIGGRRLLDMLEGEQLPRIC